MFNRKIPSKCVQESGTLRRYSLHYGLFLREEWMNWVLPCLSRYLIDLPLILIKLLIQQQICALILINWSKRLENTAIFKQNNHQAIHWFFFFVTLHRQTVTSLISNEYLWLFIQLSYVHLQSRCGCVPNCRVCLLMKQVKRILLITGLQIYEFFIQISVAFKVSW